MIPGRVPIFQKTNRAYPWFAYGDINSTFFLFFDTLGSIINLTGVLAYGLPDIVGMQGEVRTEFQKMVYCRVCPGLAFATVFGNFYYAWMARKLAGYEGRINVTALPYGINTPASIVVAFNIMLPACFASLGQGYSAAEYADAVWKKGVAANFICGILECVGAIGFHYPGQFIDILRKKYISKAALYCPIAGVGFCFLALDKFITMNYHATISLVPFAIVFTGFFAEDGVGVYGRIPSTCLLVAFGTIMKWCGADRNEAEIPPGLTDYVGKMDNFFFVGLAGLNDIAETITIVFPVALANAVETLENIEAADHVGDNYPVGEAMIADGIGTMLGASLGSVFPTTVYIGHMRHKANGATAGYSIMNGVVWFVLLMIGLTPILNAVMDSVSVGLVLMAVGLLILQQTFEVTVPRHYPAIAVGLMTVLCDFMKIKTLDWKDAKDPPWEFLNSIKNVGAGGGILLSILLIQVVCDLIDNYYSRAGVYSLILMLAALFGLVNGNNQINVDGTAVQEDQLMLVTYDARNEGWRFVVGYASLVAFCAVHYGLQCTGWIGQPITDNGCDTRKRCSWRSCASCMDIGVKLGPPEPEKESNAMPSQEITEI